VNLRLHEIPAALAAIDAAIDEFDGEIPSDLEAQLDALNLAVTEKADHLATLVRERKAAAATYREEAARLSRLASSADAYAERLSAYLKASLEALGLDKVRGTRNVVRIQRNSRPTIRWAFSQDIPESYRRVRVELDGEKAYQRWKAGDLCEGFDVTIGTHLRID
jgi:chromosome segregation ATPase